MNILRLLLVFLVFGCNVFSQENSFDMEVEGLKIKFEVDSDNRLKERLLLPSEYNGDIVLPATDKETDLSVSFHVTGENRDSHHGAKLTGGLPGLRLDYVSVEEVSRPWGKLYTVYQKDQKLGLEVFTYYEFYRGTNTCRRYTKVKNVSKKSIGVNHLSSAMINNIGNLGQGSIEEKLLVHWANNGWKTEAQWHSELPSEAGWGPNGTFQLSGIFHTNIGSMSTVKELPMAMIENKAVGLTWFWQIEHNGSWHWEFSNVRSGAKTPTGENPTYVYIGGPDEEHHQAWKSLGAGEEYVTVPVAIGCVEGGFDEAIEALTKYRRVACISPNKDNQECPVIFNDYMNCLFGDPTTEKELPLIKAASEAGCEYYVIDAGWYAEMNEKWWDAVGLWRPGNSRFPGGIERLLDSIRSNDMIPGLWLEIERVGIRSPLKKKPDSWFFMRHGKRVIDNGSYMLDFRSSNVIEHADEVIDRVVDQYGAGYVKMDYNVNSLMGTETNASSMGQGLLKHQRAYRNWMENVYDRHQDLVIENCGSGGMRMDYAMLSMNQLQSSSDQTDYKKNPAIVVGAMAAVLPEQLAVWSYPMKDGNKYEASFNMVNAMLGRIHQSGHLAELPEESFKQVKTGIEIYKDELAGIIPKSIPFFPFGMPKISDDASPIALGLKSEDADYYAVWRLSGKEVVQLEMKNIGEAEVLYPKDLGISLEQGAGKFTVSFPQQYMATIIKVKK
ncbi:alpha-galactosidase [Maribacter thermophilus]|uniref:alpha-galactosidase n=1 Tax=Maribacter thermophilus TaxID=1197874 RepID=UPI000A904BD9|nr:glycoside hydrolase family 36 protein [Maribacter thermophilus]